MGLELVGTMWVVSAIIFLCVFTWVHIKKLME